MKINEKKFTRGEKELNGRVSLKAVNFIHFRRRSEEGRRAKQEVDVDQVHSIVYVFMLNCLRSN